MNKFIKAMIKSSLLFIVSLVFSSLVSMLDAFVTIKILTWYAPQFLTFITFNAAFAMSLLASLLTSHLLRNDISSSEGQNRYIWSTTTAIVWPLGILLIAFVTLPFLT